MVDGPSLIRISKHSGTSYLRLAMAQASSGHVVIIAGMGNANNSS
jgi:hypothetical protein